MHEASIAESVINYLIDYEKKNFFSIRTVTIEIGKASNVSKESLNFCLQELAKIMYKNWNFVFLEKPLIGKCKNCNEEYEMDELKLSCSKCGDAGLDLISGDELNILELEGEEIES